MIILMPIPTRSLSLSFRTDNDQRLVSLEVSRCRVDFGAGIEPWGFDTGGSKAEVSLLYRVGYC